MPGPNDKPRRPIDPMKAAEAMFAPKKAELVSPAKNKAPLGKEAVSLRLDRDVLEFFQDEGPGWQERINEALRKVAGLDNEA